MAGSAAMDMVSVDLDEDSVEYFLIPRLDNEIPLTDEPRVHARLEELADELTVFLSGHLFSYIWQWEPFRLVASSSSIPPHLYGRTRFGDNVDDEWFIVFLLQQLSKNFPDLIIRVSDNDGEFLLIEAADYLKKWMNPETCEKRVYLYQGAVHIIPFPESPAQLTQLPVGIPSMVDAVMSIRNCSSICKADAKIQKAIRKRISGFPGRIKENQHRAHCFLPASAVAILNARPSILSAAVRAFYQRDLLDLKACRAMKYFPPETRVLTEVVFTKCLYAQLMQQKFIPDKRVGWNLPPVNSPRFKDHELGMKLACGFEILAAQSSTSESSNGFDFDSDVRFNRYLLSLTDKGYFRGEMEHSKLYNHLLQTAKLYYESNLLNNEVSSNSLIGDDILVLLNSLEVDVELLKKRSLTLKPADDDSWLNVTSEQLDNILTEHFDGATSANLNHDDGNNSNKLNSAALAESVPDAIKSFVSHVSSHEGAEFPTKRNKKSSGNKANRVTFDPDSFADAMQSILDFKLPDWEEENRSSSSSMSDYSDEDDEMDLSKPNKQTNHSETFAAEMSAYMDEMDRELAATNVGQSFERIGDDESQNKTANETDSGNGVFKPVNLELTALKNILESYNAQQGLPGPASTLLGSMGIKLPQNADE